MTNLNKIITTIAVLAATAVFFGFVFLSLSGGNAPTATPIVIVGTITPTPTPPAYPADWLIYQSDTLGLSVAHPADFTIRNEIPEMVVLLKHGPTQSLGTEVYDGVIVNISKASHSQITLKEFVDNEWATKTSDPIYTSVSQVEEVEIAGLSGFAFSTSSLGEFNNIFLPWGENEHLYITTLVADPGNLGFQETVETILDSIKKI